MKPIAKRRLTKKRDRRDKLRDAMNSQERNHTATVRAFSSFDASAPVRDMLRAAGLKFREENRASGSRYFYVQHQERVVRIRVSDHPPGPKQRNLASIHPGGETVEMARGRLVEWMRREIA